MAKLIAQEDLAELLGVEVRTLRQWRTADFQTLPKYLPCVPKATKTEKSFYNPETVLLWLKRNPEYRDKVLATLAPDTTQDALLPNALAATIDFPHSQGSITACQQVEVPSVFRLPKGGFHATSFSCCCSVSQFSKN
jgi:hypothetical protein